MKPLLLSLFFSLTIYAHSTIINFDKGWKLVGIPTIVSNMDIFKASNVEVIWSYNSSSQRWEGYSPASIVTEKLVAQNITELTSIEPYQGMWIFSKKAWDFEIEENNISQILKEDSLFLKEGWNLVSLPKKMIIPKDFFGDALVWKYKNGWSSNNSSLKFPTIQNIRESEAFWIKSSQEKGVYLSKELSKFNLLDSNDKIEKYLLNIKLSEHRRKYYDNPQEYNSVVLHKETKEVSLKDARTTTNSQETATDLKEAGLGESDLIQSNEHYIFSIDELHHKIFITSFDNIVANEYQAINFIDIEEKVLAFYLQNGRLIVVSRETDLKLIIYNIEDIYNIVNIGSYSIDGVYKDSRLVNGTLSLITEFMPTLSYKYNKIYAQGICKSLNRDEIYRYTSQDNIVMQGTDYKLYKENRCDIYNYANDATIWRYDYENPEVVTKNLLPIFPKISKLYAQNRLDKEVVITTINSFEIESASFKESLSVVGEFSSYYSSPSSFYLFTSLSEEQTAVYKFSLGYELLYKGKGLIDGNIIDNSTISEYDDYLRVATKERVTIFKESEEGLEKIGALDSSELLKGVKFIDNRAFMQLKNEEDMLYLLDLTQPTEPKNVGELSTSEDLNYLKIIDGDRLISVGRDGGLNIELFDITDMNKPVLLDKHKIGNSITQSSIERTPQAFSLSLDSAVFAIPYTDYIYTDSKTTAIEGFNLYKIEDKKIVELSDNSKIFNDKYYKTFEKRVIIFERDEKIYSVLFEGSNMLIDIMEK